MLWATSDEKTFYVALTLFIILNVAGYFFIYHRMRTAAEASGDLFYANRNFFRFAQLVLVTEYMFGTWQRQRFLFMIIFICFLDAVCFLTPFRMYISNLIHQIIPIDALIISSLLPDLGLLIFLIAAEGWIWTQRLKVSVALKTIETLSHKYKLTLPSSAND